MSITTRTGDAGTTALMFNRRVSKTHPRVCAAGILDELVAAIGIARTASVNSEREQFLRSLQDQLIALGGEIATDDADRTRWEESELPRLDESALHALEKSGRALEEKLPRATQFVRPGTDPLSAHLHYARAICRRAERSALAVREAGYDLRALVPAYLNRLSDTLWLLAREAETGN